MKFDSKQEVFEYIVKHLVRQGEPAMTSRWGECTYRSPEGLSCAVGCIIDDDTYCDSMEGKSVIVLFETKLLETQDFVNPGSDIKGLQRLLSDLQTFHDWYENWSLFNCQIDPDGRGHDSPPFLLDNENSVITCKGVVGLKKIAIDNNIFFNEEMLKCD